MRWPWVRRERLERAEAGVAWRENVLRHQAERIVELENQLADLRERLKEVTDGTV